MKTVKELAEYLRVESHAVLRWIKQGKIKAFKFGKDWRIPEEEFEFIISNGLREEEMNEKNKGDK